jgi:hypothetical protein
VRGAAQALGWELARPCRAAVAAVAAYFVVLCAVKRLVLGPASPVRLDPPNGMAGLVIGPGAILLFVFAGAFSYGFRGDLAARSSIYPGRLLMLPVTTAALAGWPMLYGGGAAAGLWLATVLVLQIMGTTTAVPIVWPSVLVAVYVAWTQALMWMPYGVAGLRVAVAVLWLMIVDTVVLAALHYHASELRMIAILAPQLPLAYVTAYAAVARARRGDVPDWRSGWARTHASSGGVRQFRSAADAQVWLEWRRFGRSLPAMAAMVVPVELLLLFVPGNDTAPIVLLTLTVAVMTPPFLAVFASASAGVATPLLAARPLTTGALAAAKLRAAWRGVAAAWLVVALAIAAAVLFSGAWPILAEQARRTRAVFDTPRAIVLVLLGGALLVTSTWMQLVQGLLVGLTGRVWVVRGTVIAALSAVVALWPLTQWVLDSGRVQGELWDALPAVLTAGVGLKMLLAVWVVLRLHRTGFIADGAIVIAAACWSAAVLALYALLAWFVDTPMVAHHVLMLAAMLVVPLVRPLAAPLALAWSRHR